MGEIEKPRQSAPVGGVVYDIGSARRRKTEAAPRTDENAIGDTARELSQANAVVEAAPDVRPERIAALRAQIENGTYAPDAREVARQILNRGL